MQDKNKKLYLLVYFLGLIICGMIFYIYKNDYYQKITEKKLKIYKPIKLDSTSAYDVLSQVIILLEVVKKFEITLANLDIMLMKIPNNNYYETNQQRYNFSKLRMAKMLEFQCEFDDVRLQILQLHYAQEKVDSLIKLLQICSNYCIAWAKADNNFINRIYYDELSLGQITARKNTEIKKLEDSIFDISTELLQYLNLSTEKILKYKINCKFKQEINKYHDAYSSDQNMIEFFILPYEWAIIRLYQAIDEFRTF